MPVQQLLWEIRELGYPGCSNLLVRYMNQGRAEAERPHIATRKAAQILLTRPDNRHMIRTSRTHHKKDGIGPPYAGDK